MMVDGAEEGQLRGPIDVLAPYSSLPAQLPGSAGARGRSGRLGFLDLSGGYAGLDPALAMARGHNQVERPQQHQNRAPLRGALP
jgi:hypothetical protein